MRDQRDDMQAIADRVDHLFSAAERARGRDTCVAKTCRTEPDSFIHLREFLSGLQLHRIGKGGGRQQNVF